MRIEFVLGCETPGGELTEHADQLANLAGSRKPVIFFGNGIGDGVLAAPALRALCEEFDGRARLIVKDGPDRWLFSTLRCAEVLFLEMRANESNSGREFEVGHAEKVVEDCDLFISLAEWESASLFKLLSRCGARSVGYFESLDVCVPVDPMAHQFDVMFSVPRFIFPDLRLEQFSGKLGFDLDAIGMGENILQGLVNPIGLHLESSDPKRCYPRGDIEELILELTRSQAWSDVFVFGQNEEYSRFELLAPQIIVCNELPLALASYLVSQMSVFVGVDSCFLHVADICRVPSVGLFGPTDPKRWGFRFAQHAHIQLDSKLVSATPKLIAELVPRVCR